MSTPEIIQQSSPFDDGELYDRVIGDLDYAVDFYVALAAQARGPVLDIACGTGRVTLPCLRAGADADGLDLSEAMLERLRKKAAAAGFAPAAYRADMSNFRLHRRYALIMITFNAFIHNMTQDDQIRCLERCREHLLPGGLLVFDTFFPGLEYLSTPQGTRVLEGETPDPATGPPMRMYDTRSIDRVAQTQHSVNELEFLDETGAVARVYRAEFTTRYVFKHEMQLLLRLAGFPRWEIHGDFDGRPLERETDAMIVFAWPDRAA